MSDDSHFRGVALGIRSLCAAAVAVVGIGQAAEAATILNVKLTLNSAVIDYSPSEGPDEGFKDVTLDEFWGLRVGETVDATFTYQEVESGEIRWLTAILVTTSGSIFEGTLEGGGPWSGISNDSNSSEYTRLTWDGNLSGTVGYSYDARPFFTSADATWTVQPAPVPLPSTAALLPLGIGALAVMRKRRRRVN